MTTASESTYGLNTQKKNQGQVKLNIKSKKAAKHTKKRRGTKHDTKAVAGKDKKKHAKLKCNP